MVHKYTDLSNQETIRLVHNNISETHTQTKEKFRIQLEFSINIEEEKNIV
jgi:hypothetical protein